MCVRKREGEIKQREKYRKARGKERRVMKNLFPQPEWRKIGEVAERSI